MSWLDKNQEKILFLAWSFILLICFLIILISPVEAASSVKRLPYDYSWNFYAMPEQVINNALNSASSSFDTSQDNVIVFWYEIGPSSWLYQYCVAQVDDITYSSGYNYDNTDLLLNNITLHFSHSFIGFTDGASFNEPANQSYAPSSWTFFGSNANFVEPAGNINATYTHMPLYGTVVLDNNLIIGTPESLVSGEATAPDLTGDDIGSDKPDIDDYLPTLPNKPTIDNSSLESLIESLIDLVDWQYYAFTGTLKGLIKYIGDTITYSLQKVIDNIKNSMKNFYDNMKSLFEPLLNSINEILSSISSGIDYIKEPLSGTAIYDELSNTGILSNYNSIVGSINSFKSSFDNLSEPSEYKIPIHLENLPSSMFGTLTTQYIDLSVINPVKSILRTFVWALVTYGLIVTIFDSIANYINGGGDE